MSSTDDQSDHDASGNLISPFYGYLPTQNVCFIFVSLFGISLALNVIQALKYRAWWLFPTAVLAAMGETAGWSGRLWSFYAPLNQTPYVIQVICTIVAPTPFVGAIFITFGRIINKIGPQYSRLSPRLYSRIFLTCDILGFLVQAGGGSIASSDGNPNLGKIGSDVMLGGIILQLASLTVFALLAAEYFWRFRNDRPARKYRTVFGSGSNATVASARWTGQPLSKPLKLLFIGLGLTTLFLFIRSIYRTIELADGFTGRIVQTQVYFNVLDGAMVVLAMYILNILHPARLLNAIQDYPDSIPLTSPK